MRNTTYRRIYIIILLTFCSASPCLADDLLSLSGRMNLRGVIPLNGDSATEYPSLTGRLKIDTPSSTWRLHVWLEGGWDGSVQLPARDRALLKKFDEVYQSNTPWLEFKELYLAFVKGDFELRAGVQRFAWGRLDEYPVNDLLNPWDYTQFLRRPLEDRKIGIPSVSANLNLNDWSIDAIWAPLLVPYRLPLPGERWSPETIFSRLARTSFADVIPAEPDLPPRTLGNGSFGLRVRRVGEIDWALNLFHGYDPRPVFRTTALVVAPLPGKILVDPGYVPAFHKMTSIGADAATVLGDWSLRGEIAYAPSRRFNIRQELWGYPSTLQPGVYPLNPSERKCDTLDYGVGADYRLMEDVLLTIQAQQTVIIDRPDTLYDRGIETLLWFNIKAWRMNQKLETNLNIAWNPEHGDLMARADAWYVFTDAWKAGMTVISFAGPPQSLFGRYAGNDQLEAEVVYSW